MCVLTRPCLLCVAGQLRAHPLSQAVRTVLMVSLGVYSQYWLLVHLSGFQSPAITLSRTYTHTLSLSLAPTHTHTLSLSLSHTYTHTHSLFLSALSLSLSLSSRAHTSH